MYTLLSKNITKNYRYSSKTIKRRSMIINDISSMHVLPEKSEVLVFFEHTISLSHLMDLEAALELDITLAVNNQKDYDLCSRIFKTKLVTWDFIDGDLVNSIILDDENQIDALSTGMPPKATSMSLDGLIDEARKLTASNGGLEISKVIASAFLNLMSTQQHLDDKYARESDLVVELQKKNTALEATLSGISSDMDDFVKAYKHAQAQVASRNIVDVMKDASSIQLPSNITTLVIKNYGVPHLMRFVSALKDSLTTSYEKYTKVLYISDPDSVSIQEINRAQFLLLGEETKASDLLKNDLLLCVGNTKEPIEFLTTASSIDAMIIVDSRRTTNELITGQTLTMYTAMDLDAAINLNLEPELTITSSEKSVYTLRESDFTGKKRHALRNNDLVTRIANTLLGGG
ncbi:hypothetical protein [Lysinibacillus xylanilyticus]|uniref:hypothetical protein n=1 Tax=Lysinibacillus xylanilyticus TaxID=582475 RepID=UPI0036DE2D2D